MNFLGQTKMIDAIDANPLFQGFRPISVCLDFAHEAFLNKTPTKIRVFYRMKIKYLFDK